MKNETAPQCPRCGTELPAGAAAGLCPRCAAAFLQASQTDLSAGPEARPTFTPPAVADLAPLFPQLEIIELLGRGGMGAVYKARQKELDRVAALKILPAGVGNDPAFAERFAREARALARLNHPGIVTIYDFGRANGLFFFLMEFVDGVTLAQLLQGSRVAPREALAIVPQICDALQYAHDQGIVHRDIKPQNILLDRRGRVKVADFGLAKLVGLHPEPPAEAPPGAVAPALTDAWNIMGTPNYMAPEQVSHPAEVDHRADIYALGVVFYQMLTGELPGRQLQPPSQKVRIDVRLDQVVLQALAKEPELRYQQASQVKTAVETIAATPGAEPPQTGMPGAGPAPPAGSARTAPVPAQPQRGWLYSFLAGFVTLLLLEFGAIAVMHPTTEGLLLGSAAGGVALALFLLARKTWLVTFLAGLLAIFLLWLGVAALVQGSIFLGLGACALVVVTLVFALRKWPLPKGFLAPFVLVFLLLFGAGTLITLLLPQTFSSTARIKLTPITPETPAAAKPPTPWGSYDPYLIQTEFEVIQSEVVLDQVIADLDLNQQWGQRFAHGQPLKPAQTMALLKRRLDLRPVRNTNLIEIRAFGETPDEPARIANAIAQVYRNRRAHSLSTPALSVEIVDRAVPGLHPVRPNKALNLALAALAGLLIGTIVGAARVELRARGRGQTVETPALNA